MTEPRREHLELRPDDETDDMCPNCVTPWKCNGPHLVDETPYMRRLLAVHRRRAGCLSLYVALVVVLWRVGW